MDDRRVWLTQQYYRLDGRNPDFLVPQCFKKVACKGGSKADRLKLYI